MNSKLKNANRDTIRLTLVKWATESCPFQQLLLQGDTFWVYCNARRYWGKYGDALLDIGVTRQHDESTRSECGFDIDWWKFIGGQHQREYHALYMRHLFEKGVDISPRGLKNSRYFDFYTDALLLFGSYDAALEYADIDPTKALPCPHGDVDIDALIGSQMGAYTEEKQEEKCRQLKRSQLSGALEAAGVLSKDIAGCAVFVDGANVSRINGKASVEHARLIDKYLQECGFAKDSINLIFDAAFRYDVNTQQFDDWRAKDQRVCLAPPNERADGVILTAAISEHTKKPSHPPFVITNDKYETYLREGSDYSILRKRKRGVTWTYIQKKPQPVINFVFAEDD
jgi:hypothetical protein